MRLLCARCGTLLRPNEKGRVLHAERDDDGRWLGQKAYHRDCPPDDLSGFEDDPGHDLGQFFHRWHRLLRAQRRR